MTIREPSNAEIIAATKAMRDVLGGCNGGRSDAECIYMVIDGNCECADAARAAIIAADTVRVVGEKADGGK